ncbi:MAG: Hsp20/alpha crystallin family protein [Deltaproteobacteria bacterium]|nr:Hsp20/alpha crystallin family protein [Deltaproteobacteria bacterium]
MLGLIPWRERRGAADIDLFRREIDSLFDRFFEGWPFEVTPSESQWIPSVDLSETNKEYIVRAEIPGVDPKDFDIALNNNVLTIRGERKHEKETKEENFHRVERAYGSFTRSIQLPGEVNADKVSANYKNGVLEITLPKVKEEAVKKIPVKTA